ncbi:hypothetical protein EVAR_36632_1 [Eumeta japonica]|uniref:Uncharacterized protein n=1 Tax=Eumeta variegata TaxID=151549 RepID=A0A4C1YPG6_EUMVA|nr:hypothetical protein EVAR_36632_1 [Eumeta japonica]
MDPSRLVRRHAYTTNVFPSVSESSGGPFFPLTDALYYSRAWQRTSDSSEAACATSGDDHLPRTLAAQGLLGRRRIGGGGQTAHPSLVHTHTLSNHIDSHQ